LDRRTFLKRAGSIPALPVLSSRFAIAEWLETTAAAAPMRRVRPSDAAWPSAASWEKLKQQVAGNLIPVASPLVPCKEAPGGAACTKLIGELKNPYFIGELARRLDVGAQRLCGRNSWHRGCRRRS
jgi:hypothetical protein